MSKQITNTAPEVPSEKEAIFGRPGSRGVQRVAVPEKMADMPMGTAYTPDKLLLPGGPGHSNRFSGPVVLDPTTGVPLGLYYYPSNPEQHANVDCYFIPASGGTVIQLKKRKA